MEQDSEPESATQADTNNKHHLLKLASVASVLVAVFLFALKAVAYFKTGSVAMLGSLLDSILDTAASTINLLFLRSAMQPADKEHRFGHGKAEPIGGMFQCMIIGGSALFLIAESVRRLIEPEMPSNNAFGIGIMVISCLLVFGLVLLQRYVVKRTGSMIVSADALHGLGDIVINLGVIFSLFISQQFDTPLVDPLVGLGLAGVLLWGAWSIGSQAIEQLMDTEFSREEREYIRELACQHEHVNDIHDLRTRRAGFTAFIQLHMEVDGKMNLIEAHQVADEVEASIQEAFPESEVFIHQDPQGSEKVDPFLRS